MVSTLRFFSARRPGALHLRARAHKLRAWLRQEWPVLVILLLPGLILSPSLFAGHATTASDIITLFPPWSVDLAPNTVPKNILLTDDAFQGSPWLLFIRSDLAAGRFPLWNAYVAGGTPFLAAAQSAVLYPPTWLAVLLPYPFGLTVMTLLQWWLAGLGMYVLARSSLSLRPLPALAAALSFMFSSFIVVWLIHPVGRPAVWLPWLLWASERALHAPSVRRVALLAGVMALVGLTGHPEMVFHVTLAAALYALWLVGTLPALGWQARLWRLLYWGSGLLLGIGLTAIQYLTMLQELPISLTVALRADEPLSGSVPLSGLLTWLVPNLWGNQTWNKPFWGPANYNEVVFYAGAVALVPAGIALLALRMPDHRRERLFFVLLGGGFLLMLYGIPPFSWLSRLPLLRFDSMQRLNLLPICAVAVLAGFGCEDMLRWARSKRPSQPVGQRARGAPGGVGQRFRESWRLLLAGLGGLAVALGSARVLVHLVQEQPTHLHWILFWVGLALVLVGGACGVVFLRWRGWLNGRVALCLVVLLMLCDQLPFAAPYVPQPQARLAYPPTPTIIRLQHTIGTNRMAAAGQILWPDSGVPYHLSDLRAFELIASARYLRYMLTLDPSLKGKPECCRTLVCPSATLLAVASVVYYATLPDEDANTCQPRSSAEAASSGPFVSLWTQGGLTLWRNTQARPRFYFASQVIPSSGESQSVADLALLSLTGRAAIIEGSARASAPGTAQGDITVMLDVSGEIRVRTQTEAGQWLIINEGYDPGWQAEVDGEDAPIHPANVLFQAVWMPAGTHTLHLTYRPTGFVLGLWTSALALLVLLSLLLSEWIRLRLVHTAMGRS